MSERYRVEIVNTCVIEVTVVADSPQEASERALQGEGSHRISWTKEPETARVEKLTE